MEGVLIYSNQAGGEEVAPDFPTPQEECKAPPQDPTVHLESLTGHCPHVLMDYLSVFPTGLEYRRALLPPQSLAHSRHPVTE